MERARQIGAHVQRAAFQGITQSGGEIT